MRTWDRAPLLVRRVFEFKRHRQNRDVSSTQPHQQRTDRLRSEWCGLHNHLPFSQFQVDGVGQNGGLPSPWNAIPDTPSSSLTILEFE
jgi:hypothetical protein